MITQAVDHMRPTDESILSQMEHYLLTMEGCGGGGGSRRAYSHMRKAKKRILPSSYAVTSANQTMVQAGRRNQEDALKNYLNVNKLITLIANLSEQLDIDLNDPDTSTSSMDIENDDDTETSEYIMSTSNSTESLSISDDSHGPPTEAAVRGHNSIYYAEPIHGAVGEIKEYNERIRREANRAYLKDSVGFEFTNGSYDSKYANPTQTGGGGPTNLCNICFQNEKNILLHPCQHLVMCGECASIMMKEKMRRDDCIQIQCPICRIQTTSLSCIKNT